VAEEMTDEALRDRLAASQWTLSYGSMIPGR
jgi:hypothetical protein